MASLTHTSLKPQTSKYKIVHPVSGDTKFMIGDTEVEGILTIVGQYSDEYVAAVKDMAEKFEKISKTEQSKIVLDTSKQLQYELYARCIIDWEDNGFFSTPYSAEEAVDLLSKTENGWLVDQIAAYIADTSNFFFQK